MGQALGEDDLEEQRRRWRAHCGRMAAATYALADCCEEPKMLGGYLQLAAMWVNMADALPAPGLDEEPASADAADRGGSGMTLPDGGCPPATWVGSDLAPGDVTAPTRLPARSTLARKRIIN